MSWAMIFVLAAVLYFNRYFFLEPKVKVRLPRFLEKMLGYAAPCLLSVICIPIVFFDESSSLRTLGSNAYLWATVIACVVAYKVKSVLLNMAISLVAFYSLLYVFNY